jgi:carbonic anhydrase/acetyltransferase-like protein (isoleucine patch superfamily)
MPYRNILSYLKQMPTIHQSVFVANNATITGKVNISEHSSIWFGCVLRGDVTAINIGSHTNIQDSCILHGTRPNHAQNKTGKEGAPVFIGNYVTIGHSAIIHACEVQDYAFVGMGSIVMDLAIIEQYAMLAAGAVLTPGKVIKSKQIWAGNPAKYLRDMTQTELDYIKTSAQNYVELAIQYKTSQ